MTQPSVQRPILVLVYAGRDSENCQQLRGNMNRLARDVDIFDIRDVTAGEEWARTRERMINSAQAIVLLLSVNLTSPNEEDRDLDALVDRALSRKATALVIGLLLKSVLWDSERFAGIQLVPQSRVFLESDGDKDARYATAAQEIEEAVFRRAMPLSTRIIRAASRVVRSVAGVVVSAATGAAKIAARVAVALLVVAAFLVVLLQLFTPHGSGSGGAVAPTAIGTVQPTGTVKPTDTVPPMTTNTAAVTDTPMRTPPGYPGTTTISSSTAACNIAFARVRRRVWTSYCKCGNNEKWSERYDVPDTPDGGEGNGTALGQADIGSRGLKCP